MKTNELKSDEIREAVREHYDKVARRAGGCGCAADCCEPTAEGRIESLSPDAVSPALGYSAEDTIAAPEGASLSLGCGNPLAIAALSPGQTVLDLGCGAGFDAFLAARRVGPTGLVIGVDMTAEMLAKARANRAAGNYANVDFRLGEIEHLPVADGSVDVIISNCVINLSPDKAQVFREAFRVLKPGGRLAIADILALAPLPDRLRNNLRLFAGCVAGASLIADVKSLLHTAGFREIRVEPKPESRALLREWFPGQGIEDYIVSATVEAVK